MNQTLNPTQSPQTPQDWDQAFLLFSKVIACEPEPLQLRAILHLARLSKDAPESALTSTLPILIDLLARPRPALQSAAAHSLCRLARTANGNLCAAIGQLGAMQLILRLLPTSRNGIRKSLLRCLAAAVAFDGPNRVILARNNGLEIVLSEINNCLDDTKRYLLEILSALALLREVRRVIVNVGGLPFIVEALSHGKMASRTRAAQAVGLLGVARRVRHMLVDLGAVNALVGLLRDADVNGRLTAGNALGILASHVDYIGVVAEAGAIPLYMEMLQENESLGKEIAEDVFCVLAVAEDNAVAIAEQLVGILESGGVEAKGAALDVMWALAGYKHSVSVVRDSGAITVMLEILRDGDFDLREKVLGVVAQLSSEKGNRGALAEEGVIPVLIDMLRGDSEELREYAAEALINFAEDPVYHDNVSEVFHIPAFLAIQDRLNRIRSSDEHVVRSLRLLSVEELTSDPVLV